MSEHFGFWCCVALTALFAVGIFIVEQAHA